MRVGSRSGPRFSGDSGTGSVEMDAIEHFSLFVERNGRGPVVRLSGEIDIATAPELRECLESLDGQAVTIDFSDVTYMDSSGVNVLVEAIKRAHDGGGVPPVLRGVQPNQMRILELTGVAELLTVDG
jgi:anti-sigma B factor antagonist